MNWATANPEMPSFVFALDEAGNENYRLFLHEVATGQSQRFTNGFWHNTFPVWSRDGLLLAFTSNARNGKDRDLYVISPPDTATGRKLKEADGYCIAHDWSPDGSRIVATESRFHRREQVVVLIDVLNGRIESLPTPSGIPAFRDHIRWSGDGAFAVLADEP